MIRPCERSSSIEHDDRALRFFSVGFHGGEVRVAYSDKKDAFSSIKQLEANAITQREMPGGG
jgi:hypothetical protein